MATLYRDWSEYALGDTIGVEITDIVATQESGAEYETKQIVARASGPAGRALDLNKTGTTPRQLFLAFTDAGITGAATGEIYCEIEAPSIAKQLYESGPCSHIPADGVTRSGITAQGRGGGGNTVIPCIRSVTAGTIANSGNGTNFTANTDVFCQLYRFTTVGADLTLQYKWWRRDFESEPASWGLTWTANAFVGQEGRLGFARLSYGEQYLLFIGIGTGADPAPRAAAGGTDATLALTDAPDSLALTTSITTVAALGLTDAPDALALAVEVPTSAILALTDAPDSLALTASITTVAALVLTDAPDSLALTTSIGVSHDIRLTLGIYAEQGAALSQTGMRYVVLAADLASVVASGSALDTGAGGVVSIDINGSPYVVGDYVPVLITEYNDITAPPDRTVRSMFGFVPATAQP